MLKAEKVYLMKEDLWLKSEIFHTILSKNLISAIESVEIEYIRRD